MGLSADREIADSQADEEDHLNDHYKHPAESFRTQPTVLIPGGTRLTVRSSERYTLHAKGVNVNGHLPLEASRYKDMVAMDEVLPPTQVLSQQLRAGTKSITIDDESDIICILQPANRLAYDVATVIAKITPQHMLKNNQMFQDHEDVDLEYDLPVGSEATSAKPKSASDSMEIALRISSKVKDICMGFVFGRDPLKCDIMLDLPDDKKRISGMHFRIFVNEGGIIMLEDTSTNGTLVDDKLLKYRDPLNCGARQMHMIQKGSVIQIILGINHTVMFRVTTPNRDRGLSTYQKQLAGYLNTIKLANRNHAAAGIHAIGARAPLQLPLLGPGTGKADPASPTTQSVTTPPMTLLTAGSTTFTCGVHWNGGELYNVIEHIGKGAFADVYKFATKREGKLVAVKELEKRRFIKNGILDHKVTNELKIMKCLNHPHIIKYMDHREEPAYLFIVMEYVNHGDMLNYLNAYGKMDEHLCQSVARQLTHALKYLHKCGVTHRDIKPDNILISSLDPFLVKLSDFGLSKVIENDDTFLKTFCGTLLYCAPEVYPEYDHYKQGHQYRKRYRHGEPASKPSPYSSAVDIWSFAAVVFHLLCNKPPYKGSGENRGALMLRTIMENPLDIAPLRQSGISRLGISFLEQMLRVDPTERLNAAECLRNPWIRDIADVALIAMDDEVPPQGLADIREEEEEDIDASQLSLNDMPSNAQPHISDFDGNIPEADEIGTERRSKRIRTLDDYLEERYEDHASQQNRRDNNYLEPQRSHLGGFAYPPLSIIDRINAVQVTQAPPNRLFGEIGSSDLQSSGVLSHGAHAALQIVSPGNNCGEGSYDEDEASEASSDLVHQDNLQYPTPIAPPYLRRPIGSALSLLGAEAQIGHLNMASPESGISTPATPQSRQISPDSSSITGSKRSNRAVEAGGEETTPKRLRITAPRQLTPKMATYWYDDNDPSTHNLEYAPRASGRDFIGELATRRSNSHTSSLSENKPRSRDYEESRRHSSASENQVLTDEFPMNHKQMTTVHLKDHLASTTTGRHGLVESVRSKAAKDNAAPSKSVASACDSAAEAFNTAASSLNTASFDKNLHTNSGTTTAENFVRPLPRAGRLVTVEGSIISTSLNLDQRITSWGRDPASNTYVYPNSMDTRVPKAALDIIFWRSGIERELEYGADFRKMPDVCALIQTRCSKSIKINDVHLTRAKGDGWTYGVLRQGDIITIFDGPAGFLKFRCEFYIGLSKEERALGEVFMVEKEVDKFMQYMSGQTSPTDSETVGVRNCGKTGSRAA